MRCRSPFVRRGYWLPVLAWLAAAAAGSPTGATGAAADEDATRVYQKLTPSVVSLQNEEGSGSGILVRPDGLVLTNAHVVSSPMPLDVRVTSAPGKAGAPEAVFKRVRVAGYHPTLDLALV